MPDSSVLSEYLVKLGFSTDKLQYSQFLGALKDVESQVNNRYLNMAKKAVEFQLAATSAFIGIGASALGLMDHVAQADQQYRLFALRMHTSLPVARELKIALDALGQPLENVIWDQELAQRVKALTFLQHFVLEPQLGPDFEANMKKIRDVRLEVLKFGIELEYLGMNVVNDLARVLPLDDWLKWLDHFNRWFIANIPYFAYVISTNVKPALAAVKQVLSDTWDVVKQLNLDFIHFVGILSGDDKLKNSKGNFEDLAAAIKKTGSEVMTLVEGMLKLEKNIALLFDAGQQALSGNMKAAIADLTQMQPIGAPELTTAAPKNVGRLIGAGPALATASNVKAAIIADAQMLGVKPALALAVAAQESGYRQFDKSGQILRSNKGALGVMQLMPSTAKMLGVDPSDTGQNIMGGIQYLKQLLGKHHGSEKVALSIYSGHMKGYPEAVMQREATIQVSGDLIVNVNAKTDAKPTEIAQEFRKVLRDMAKPSTNLDSKAQTQRNLNEFQKMGWSAQ